MKIFYYITIFSSLIPLLYTVTTKKNYPVKSYFKSFQKLLIIRFLSDLFGVVLLVIYKNSIPVFHISVILETILYLNIISFYFSNVTIRIIQTLTIFLGVTELLFFNGIWENNWFTTITSYLGISIMYFEVVNRNVQKLDRPDLFLISVVLIYHLIMLIYSITEDLLRDNTELFQIVLPIILFVFLMYNLCLTKFIWLLKRNLD